MFQQILSKISLHACPSPQQSAPESVQAGGFTEPHPKHWPPKPGTAVQRESWAESMGCWVLPIKGWIIPLERRACFLGEKHLVCPSVCPSQSLVGALGRWQGSSVPAKCQQASFWHLYMRSKHNPSTIPTSCLCQEKSFVTLFFLLYSASPAGLAWIALTPRVPAGAARQSRALCTSWQVLPRAEQLCSRLEPCLAVSFSFSSSLFLGAAAAAFFFFFSVFIPFLGL